MTTPAAARTDEDGARFYPIPDGTGEVHRLTNISGVLDVLHSFGLTDWKVVNSLVGTALRTDLQARIIAAHHLPDPKERKRALKAIASDAVEAGQCYDPAKGYLANDFGTAIHLLTELVDSGNVTDLFAMPGIVRGQVAAYIDTITAHGIQTVMSEFTVYSFTYGYAGTLDRMWRFTRTEHNAAAFDEYDLGRGCFGADTKTGSIYPKVAMQLAGAVNAEGVYDAATGERSPLPADVRTDIGFVLQLSGDKAKLVPVDLTAAWPAFTGALAVKAFDVTKPLGKALPHVRTEVEPPHAAPTVTAAAEVTAPPAVTSAAPIEAPVLERADAAAEHVANATRRKSLLEKRMSMDPATVEALRDVWPVNVPGLPTDHAHTAAELDLIEEAISKVWPAFPEPDPEHDLRHSILMERLDELPSDLQAIVRGLCDFGTSPDHALTPQRMAHLEAMLTEAEATYTERTTRISAAMATLGPDLELAALSVIGVDDLDAFTAWELDQLELLAAYPDALGEQPKGFVKDHGGARDVVAAARAAAKVLHRATPRSAADVLADPILIAAVATSEVPQPQASGEAAA